MIIDGYILVIIIITTILPNGICTSQNPSLKMRCTKFSRF